MYTTLSGGFYCQLSTIMVDTSKNHFEEGGVVRLDIVIRIHFFLILYCTPLFGSGLGIRADLKDVHVGVVSFIAQPMGDLHSLSVNDKEKMTFTPGLGIKVFASVPVFDVVQLRSGVSFAAFRGYQDDSSHRQKEISCEHFSLESDMLFFLSGLREREGVYIIVGATVDYIHYRGLFAGGDLRITDNAINVGFGRSYRSDAVRFILEINYHKTVVHDREVLVTLPRADRMEFCYGVVF